MGENGDGRGEDDRGGDHLGRDERRHASRSDDLGPEAPIRRRPGSRSR